MDVQWAQILTIIGANLAIMITSIGITIALYMHSDKKIDAIAQEMKDFHGKLCAIEEKKRDLNDRINY